MINQDLINEALLYASNKHNGQYMKQPIVPYMTHLQGVCLEAINGCINENNKDINLEKVTILALLHDTMEDTDATYEEVKDLFGEDVANGVLALTKNEKIPYSERMLDSINRIKKQSVEVAIVKLADRIFNLKDVPIKWDKNKILAYKEEAKLILKELGFASEYLSKRLQDKINVYGE